MPRTIWLASYPKSGNTWLRLFLANLLPPEQAPVDLNQLSEPTPIAASRGHFDDLLGAPSALLTQTEIDRLRLAADAVVDRGIGRFMVCADGRRGQRRPSLRLHRPPASGKSTVAALLVQRGYQLVSDGLLREQRCNELEGFVSSRRPGARGFETLLQHAAGHAWFGDLADRRALFQWGHA